MFELLLSSAIGKTYPPLTGNVTLLESNAGPSLSGGMSVIHRDYLYVAGGTITGVATATFKRYNLIEKQWENLANLLNVRAAGSLLAVNNKLYLFGGYTTTSSTYDISIHEYDIATNKWRSLANSPNLGRAWFSSAVVGTRLYYFGGWNGTQLRIAECFDTVTNTFFNIQQMPETRHGHCSVGANGEIYIFAGLTNGGATVNNSMYIYNIGEQIYRSVSLGQRPPVRCYSGMVTGFNKVYIFGGYTDGNGTDSLNDCWSMGIGVHEWTKLTLSGDPLTKRAVYSYGLWNNEFHILFGQGSAGGNNRTDHLMIT